MSASQAIYKACELRVRPILMTTLAAMLGALPLAFGQGDGSELRHPLGVSVLGGLVLSQLLTLYTTPVVYVLLEGSKTWIQGLRLFKGSSTPKIKEHLDPRGMKP